MIWISVEILRATSLFRCWIYKALPKANVSDVPLCVMMMNHCPLVWNLRRQRLWDEKENDKLGTRWWFCFVVWVRVSHNLGWPWTPPIILPPRLEKVLGRQSCVTMRNQKYFYLQVLPLTTLFPGEWKGPKENQVAQSHRTDPELQNWTLGNKSASSLDEAPS